jgi:hypothetical protein
VDKAVKEAGKNAVHLLENAALSRLSAALPVASPANPAPARFIAPNGEIQCRPMPKLIATLQPRA